MTAINAQFPCKHVLWTNLHSTFLILVAPADYLCAPLPIVVPEMKIVMIYSHSSFQTCTNFLCWTRRNCVTGRLTVAIDFHSIFFHSLEVGGYRQLSGYTHLSKYIFCVQQKRETGLKQHEGELMICPFSPVTSGQVIASSFSSISFSVCYHL